MNNWHKLLHNSNTILFSNNKKQQTTNEEYEIYTLIKQFLGNMGNYVCDHKNYNHKAQRFQARANDENSTIVYYCEGCGYSVDP